MNETVLLLLCNESSIQGLAHVRMCNDLGYTCKPPNGPLWAFSKSSLLVIVGGRTI